MTPREIFRETCTFGTPERTFRWEVIAAWATTLERWHAEGLPPNEGDTLYSLYRYFGMDWHIGFLNFDVETGIITGTTRSPYAPPIPEETLEEDERTRIYRDTNGVIRKEFKEHKETSMPQFLGFPVTNRREWEALERERLQLNPADRFPSDWEALEKHINHRDYPLGMQVTGAFGHPRNLLGLERLLVTYYDDPSWIHEIMENWAWLYEEIVAVVCSHFDLDYLLFWEDMAFNTAPLLSPQLFRQFMLPYYKRVVEVIRGHGVDLVFVDTDGNMESLIPLFLEAGINGFFPFERAAGMDPLRIRKRYGDAFAIFGGIDKREFSKGRAAIAAEIEAIVPPLLESGGFIPMLDHSAPPDISLDAMRFAIDQIRDWSRRIHGA